MSGKHVTDKKADSGKITESTKAALKPASGPEPKSGRRLSAGPAPGRDLITKDLSADTSASASASAALSKESSWGDVLSASVKKPLPVERLWTISESKEPSLQFSVRVESVEGYYDVNLELPTEIVQKALKKLIKKDLKKDRKKAEEKKEAQRKEDEKKAEAERKKEEERKNEEDKKEQKRKEEEMKKEEKRKKRDSKIAPKENRMTVSLSKGAAEKDPKPANWKDVLGSSALFGTSLDQVMERQKEKYPDLKIPKFIRAGMDFIILHGISAEGIFRLSGTQNRINEMKEKLNQAGELDFEQHEDPHNISGLLKLFLRELPEPLLLKENYSKFLGVLDGPQEQHVPRLQALVSTLPTHNQYLLREMCRFLFIVGKNAEFNKMGMDNLGRVIGPNILSAGKDLDLAQMQMDSDRVNRVAAILIKDWAVVFSHLAPPPLKDENLEFKFASSHKKSVQGMIPVEAASGRRFLWSWDSNGEIRVWDTKTFAQHKSLPAEASRGLLSTLYPVNHQVWILAERGVFILDSDTFALVKELKDMTAFSATVDSEKKLVWIGTWEGLRSYNLNLVTKKETTKDVKLLHVQKGQLWVAASRSLVVYDDSLAVLKEFNNHTRKVNAFVSIDDTRLASVSDDTKVIVWDSHALTAQKTLDAHQGKVMTATRAKGSPVFYTASWDTSIKVWSCDKLECLRELKGYHSDAISGLALLAAENGDWQLWTSSWDRHFCVFKLKWSGPASAAGATPTGASPLTLPLPIQPEEALPSGGRGRALHTIGGDEDDHISHPPSAGPSPRQLAIAAAAAAAGAVPSIVVPDGGARVSRGSTVSPVLSPLPSPTPSTDVSIVSPKPPTELPPIVRPDGSSSGSRLSLPLPTSVPGAAVSPKDTASSSETPSVKVAASPLPSPTKAPPTPSRDNRPALGTTATEEHASHAPEGETNPEKPKKGSRLVIPRQSVQTELVQALHKRAPLSPRSPRSSSASTSPRMDAEPEKKSESKEDVKEAETAPAKPKDEPKDEHPPSEGSKDRDSADPEDWS